MIMNNFNKLYRFLAAAAVTAALAACSADEPQEAPQPAPQTRGLVFQVEDEGMTPLKGTRAIDNKNYTKQLLAGDAIGVFRAYKGLGENTWKVDAVNVKYVLDENGQWNYENTNALIASPEAETGFQSDQVNNNEPVCYYFAYYPYQGSGDTFAIQDEDYLQSGITADTDAATFFAGLIAKWRPKHDQSTQAKYSNQDLMVAKATVNNSNTVVFQMAHQMAMVEIRFNQELGVKFNSGGIGTKYRFKDDPDYYVGLDFSEKDLMKNDNQNYSCQNCYRLIVRPDEVTTIQGVKYNPDTDALLTSNPNWYVQTSHQLTKGQYQVFGTATLANPMANISFNLGDILYSDGTFQSTAVSGHGDPLGVVVYKNGSTNSGTYIKNRTCEKDENPKCGGNAFKIAGRGLVMAFTYAVPSSTAAVNWAASSDYSPTQNITSYSNYSSSYNISNGYFPNITDWNGAQYDFYGLGKTNANINVSSSAFNQIKTYRTNNPNIPIGCSDWFMPSIGQWTEILRANGSIMSSVGDWGDDGDAFSNLNSYIQKRGGTANTDYRLFVGYGSNSVSPWISSEKSSDQAWSLLFNNESSRQPYFHAVAKTGDSNARRQARPFLAF